MASTWEYFSNKQHLPPDTEGLWVPFDAEWAVAVEAAFQNAEKKITSKAWFDQKSEKNVMWEVHFGVPSEGIHHVQYRIEAVIEEGNWKKIFSRKIRRTCTSEDWSDYHKA